MWAVSWMLGQGVAGQGPPCCRASVLQGTPDRSATTLHAAEGADAAEAEAMIQAAMAKEGAPGGGAKPAPDAVEEDNDEVGKGRRLWKVHAAGGASPRAACVTAAAALPPLQYADEL